MAGDGRCRIDRRRLASAALAAAFAFALAFALLPASRAVAGELQGIHKIKHVIVVMQENRSFDSYFGTYPGVKGIPAGVCMPDPLNGSCDTPFHDPNDKNYGGPHGEPAFAADLDGGKMDGFVTEAEKGLKCLVVGPLCEPCTETPSSTQCIDVMGYHDAREIPNYWTYAQNFVLQDHMYEPVSSWSWPEHLFAVSGWSATCSNWSDPMSCVAHLEGPPNPDQQLAFYETHSLPWTDVTYLLHKHSVSWGYYIAEGDEPDCESDEAMTCAPVKQGPTTPGIWNPLLDFLDVKEDNQTGNIQSLNHFYEALHTHGKCGLPSVSWVVPNGKDSEHPTSPVSLGQTYVTTLLNAIGSSLCWNTSAVFVSWDDWGGFYDSVVPPVIDESGYGFRVPGLVISPYARAGYVDHRQFSHDAYLRFIENDFLEAERLNPATDGRPDSRPDVREVAPGLQNLVEDFDFEQPPRPPLILPAHPAPGPASCPPGTSPVGGGEPGECTQTARASDSDADVPRGLTLTASVERSQDAARSHRVYLTVGCNETCALLARGALSVGRGTRAESRDQRAGSSGQRAALRDARIALEPDRSERIALGLSKAALDALLAARREGHGAQALVTLDATGVDGAHRRYRVRVELL